MTNPRNASIVLRWQARCGEGPVWDEQDQAVHWVDILAGQIHTTDIPALTTRTITLPALVGAVAPCQAGGFVAAVTEGFAYVAGPAEFDIRAKVLAGGQRMNDAKCDSSGRFWAGSTTAQFSAGAGALWVLDQAWRAEQVLDRLTLPNGMGWSPDDRTFYLADTIEREISAFDFDPSTGSIARRRRFAHFTDETEGMPDGLCIDNAGCLWVAMWGGSRIMRYSPAGERLCVIQVPVTQPSSCAFVGPRLSDLWITSAREGLALADGDPRPDGSILAIAATGAVGLPARKFAGQ